VCGAAARKANGNELLKKISLSFLRAEPDGAYILMNLIPLYSADMARPDGSL
jgi:hypothetical protein